ncbi:flavodoxin family protein [Paenimyroides tangerinum]|uniref:Flavodoxin family protein n=1 Tax=Paenimyroides tangerinum TaxID=2488728 RepID=A0A3P3VUY5_9FLAO|nr:flavodoxin family protein [Paenimyroides tangerinum]
MNINEEQRVLELFDKIVFQFPIYLYNCPPLLKKWFDEVLMYGWAYSKTFKFEGKSVALCLSTNGLFEDYQPTGKYKYRVKHKSWGGSCKIIYLHHDG